MIPRQAARALDEALGRQAAVVLVGPRQVGKTTMAMDVASRVPSIYLDLERPADRAKLSDAELFLEAHRDRLVILDEIHRMPELFQVLRGVIDRGRRDGRRTGRFLMLGSAAIDLLRQSGETLAGRVAHIELGPILAEELPPASATVPTLWVRGGFPESLLASNDAASAAWRRDFIRTYLERDIPQFGPRIPAETLRRFWTMLAHAHGGLLNASALARNLETGAQSIGRYVDLLVDLLLVRRLMPHHRNLGKRLVKSPKVYLRDTGILHALLGLDTMDELLGHPVVGASWEGMVIEHLIAAAPPLTSASFYRTAAGAEIDLLLQLPNGDIWAVEIKSGQTPRLERGFHHAREDIKPARSLVVCAVDARYPLGGGIEAIGVVELARELRALS